MEKMVKYCIYCNTPAREGERFCTGCGAIRPEAVQHFQQWQTSFAPVNKNRDPLVAGGIAVMFTVVLIITLI